MLLINLATTRGTPRIKPGADSAGSEERALPLDHATPNYAEFVQTRIGSYDSKTFNVLWQTITFGVEEA